MKKKILILIIFLTSINFLINSQVYYSNEKSIRLVFNAGVSYNFPIMTDYTSQTEMFFIDIPFSVCMDIRYFDWFSIYTGLELTYALHMRNQIIDEANYTYYLHYLFIRFPLMVKFYPMVRKDEAYHNFYFAVGGLLHFWPLNLYYVTVDSQAIHSGNAYYPSHPEMPPGNIYTPVNIGFKAAIGNHFPINQRILLGMEFYINYLFIPFINGYYFGNNYNRGNLVILEFNGNIGVVFSIALNLIGE